MDALMHILNVHVFVYVLVSAFYVLVYVSDIVVVCVIVTLCVCDVCILC